MGELVISLGKAALKKLRELTTATKPEDAAVDPPTVVEVRDGTPPPKR